MTNGPSPQTSASSIFREPSNSALRRVLGMPFGVAAVIGGAIGSGILRAPGPVAAALPDAPLLLVVWTLGGLLAMIEALPLIELATSLPRAGGAIIYVERAFGHVAGTLAGWANLLQCIVSIAFMAVVFGEFAQHLGIAAPIGLQAVILIIALTAINLADTRWSGGSQTVGAIAKLAGLLLLIGVLLLMPPSGTMHPAPSPALTAGGIVLAIMLVNNTYQGWSAIVPFVEEMRDPTRTVARAMFVGIAAITVTYLAMNAALLHVLPLGAVARSTLPAADAIGLRLGLAGDRLITIVSLISVVTIANLTVMLPARILLALARAGSAPQVFARIGGNGSPAVATVAVGGAAALFASSGAYLTLNAIYAPLATLTAIAVLLAAWRLRHAEPTLPRPWRMPGYPAPIVLALVINLALLVAFLWANPRASLGALALLVLSAWGAFLLGSRRAAQI